MQVAGIEKINNTYRVAFMRRGRNSIEIEKLSIVDSIPKQTGYLVSGLKDVLIRKLSSPIKRKSVIYATLPFQLESTLPFPINEAVIAPTLKKHGDHTEITVFAKSLEDLKNHLENLPFDPEFVSCNSMALYRFSKFVSKSESTKLLIHIGYDTTLVVLVAEGFIEGSFEVSIGYTDFMEAIEKDAPALAKEEFQNVNFSALDEAVFENTHSLFANFIQEIDRIGCFFKKKHPKIKNSIVSGYIDQFFQMESYLSKKLGLSPSEITIKKGFDFTAVKPYAITIGLGIDVLQNDNSSLQFRQGKLTHKRLSASLLGKYALTIALGCFLAFLATKVTGKWIDLENQKIKSEVTSFIAPLTEEMPELKGQKTLKGVLKKLRGENESYHYYKPSPKVKDVLSYLKKFKGIQFTKINTDLIGFPEMKNPFANYVMKVSLTFQVDDAKVAKSFHDYLLKGDDFVDATKKQEWTRDQDGYKATFFIKT